VCLAVPFAEKPTKLLSTEPVERDENFNSLLEELWTVPRDANILATGNREVQVVLKVQTRPD
jgi:hypothetical protein